MKKIIFNLTEEQKKVVQPFLRKADKAHREYKPGMVLAQIWETQDGAIVVCGFFEHDKAIAIQSATDAKVVGQGLKQQQIEKLAKKAKV